MGKKRVLVVEDEPDLVLMLKERLSANGYAVYSALDGLDGIRQAKKIRPDIILLDVMMPKLDGYSMAKRLKEDDSTTSIPLIVVTIKESMKELFKELGVNYFFPKPFDDNELLNTIKSILEEEKNL